MCPWSSFETVQLGQATGFDGSWEDFFFRALLLCDQEPLLLSPCLCLLPLALDRPPGPRSGYREGCRNGRWPPRIGQSSDFFPTVPPSQKRTVWRLECWHCCASDSRACLLWFWGLTNGSGTRRPGGSLTPSGQ